MVSALARVLARNHFTLTKSSAGQLQTHACTPARSAQQLACQPSMRRHTTYSPSSAKISSTMNAHFICRRGSKSMTSENPLLKLRELGQSIWLDFLSRGLIRSGRLKTLIDNDGVSGVTSNPAIFEKAINGSSDYDADIRRLAERGKTPMDIYQELAISDIRDAADLLLPIYSRTSGNDGYVS